MSKIIPDLFVQKKAEEPQVQRIYVNSAEFAAQQARLQQAEAQRARAAEAEAQQAQARLKEAQQARIRQARIEQAMALQDSTQQSREQQARTQQVRNQQARNQHSRNQQARNQHLRNQQVGLQQAQGQQARGRQIRERQARSQESTARMQARQQQASLTVQARTNSENLLDERNAAALDARARDTVLFQQGDDPNAATRFDAGMTEMSGEFFDEFTQSNKGFGEKDSSSSVEILLNMQDVEGELSAAELARVLPTGENDGIFEIIFPSGERMGVVVSSQASSLSYLLSPGSEKFGSRLREQKMELEGHLEQLTHRNVNITVL